MADLGVIGSVYPIAQQTPSPVYPATGYEIERGLGLGPIETFEINAHRSTLFEPLTGYVVRQIRVLYRQLWPSHGQRFPQ